MSFFRTQCNSPLLYIFAFTDSPVAAQAVNINTHETTELMQLLPHSLVNPDHEPRAMCTLFFVNPLHSRMPPKTPVLLISSRDSVDSSANPVSSSPPSHSPPFAPASCSGIYSSASARAAYSTAAAPRQGRCSSASRCRKSTWC